MNAISPYKEKIKKNFKNLYKVFEKRTDCENFSKRQIVQVIEKTAETNPWSSKVLIKVILYSIPGKK